MNTSIKRLSLWVCAVTMVVLGGLVGTNAKAASGVSVSPVAMSFGSVSVSSLSSPQAFAVMNAGSQKVTIQSIASSNSQFLVTGPTLPVTLPPGQGASFQILFSPTSVGAFYGNISVSLSRWSQKTSSIAVSGTGVTTAQTLLLSSATSLNLGNVLVGGSSSQSVVLTNTGNSSVSISQVAVSGTEFAAGGLAVPMTLAVGQSASLTVIFSPVTAGTVLGSVSVVGTATNSPTTIALTGTGQTLQLTPSAASLSFGSVLVGTSSSKTVTISNTGNSSVTISQVTVTGTGFMASGILTPLTLAAGQSALLTVAFSPTTAVSIAGSLSVLSNATNSPTTTSLTGTGVQPQISVVPSSVPFGNVVVGTSNSQMINIQNSGTASLSVTQATVSGQGFALTGPALPLSVPPGGSASFTLSFTPTSATSVSGVLYLVSNAPGSPSTVGLSGIGLAQTLQLSASPTSLTFAGTTVGTSTSRAVTISNTGNSDVSVTQIGVSGTSYSVSGAALPISLSAGQSTSVTVVFAPLGTGSLVGSISIISNATNSPAAVTLNGSGVQANTPSASLSWSDSSTGLGGFNIYRSTTSGGPYAKINSAVVPTTAYTDSTVKSGTTYYYVTTAVDPKGESAYSNEAVAIIP